MRFLASHYGAKNVKLTHYRTPMNDVVTVTVYVVIDNGLRGVAHHSHRPRSPRTRRCSRWWRPGAGTSRSVLQGGGKVVRRSSRFFDGRLNLVSSDADVELKQSLNY